MAKPLPLPVWDRQGGKLISEWMDNHQATYESEPRRSITQWIKSQPLYDWLYAAYQNTHLSAQQIEPFVRKYHIDMNEFEPVEYRSFAEFFDRRFRPGVRKFPSAPDEMGAFAEARYFAWDRLECEQRFPVKGHSLSAEKILGNSQRARPSLAARSSWYVWPRSIITACTIPMMAGLWIRIGSGTASGP
jgi:phosphatidylserine decarboxylase